MKRQITEWQKIPASYISNKATTLLTGMARAIPNKGKDVEELELPYAPGGNIKWNNHFIKVWIA